MTTNLQQWVESLKTTGKPDVDEAITVVGHLFPELKKYKYTSQDAEWHAEGDVHIHTDMVLDELYKIFDTKEFIPTPEQRQVLILGALLHDIAKPFTTWLCPLSNRIKAPKHEEKGRNYLIYPLLELKLNFKSYLDVLNLVGLHQKPKLLILKNANASEYIQLNKEVNYELLYWLEIADIRGRTCSDKEEQLMYLDEYKSLSAGYINDITRYEIPDYYKQGTDLELKYRNIVSDYLLQNNFCYSLSGGYSATFSYSKEYSHAVILCGLSGSGKTTYIKDHYPDYKVISLDLIRAKYSKLSNHREVIEGNTQQESRLLLRQALAAKENVVWDATNLTEESRIRLISICHRYHALTELVVLITPLDVIFNQNKNRVSSIPEEAIKKQISRFEFPSVKETHIVNYILKEQ